MCYSDHTECSPGRNGSSGHPEGYPGDHDDEGGGDVHLDDEVESVPPKHEGRLQRWPVASRERPVEAAVRQVHYLFNIDHMIIGLYYPSYYYPIKLCERLNYGEKRKILFTW